VKSSKKSSATSASNSSKWSQVLRSFEGPLTEELVLHPGKFGLGKVPGKLSPERTTNVTCGYCSTGCGLEIHLDAEGAAINLSATPDYPVNLGMACPKGWEALSPLQSPDRGIQPLLRLRKKDPFRPVSWRIAAETFAARFKAIQAAHGNESVAFLSTGQIVTEEMAYLGALTKFGMGWIHGDANTRQCMATAAVAYKQSFGYDAPPFTYKDFELSDVIILVGSNLCIAHPIMWQRVMRNPHKPEIIVVDPRRTETAVAATQHLAIAPKSDLVLFYTLANMLIQNGWIQRDFIRNHTKDFDAFARHVSEFTPARAVEETGLAREQINRLAATIHRRKRVSFWWTMGVNQSYEGVRLAQSLINLALITGNIGRPGTGANSITGQCNAMGSRLFSNTTTLLGGRDFLNPDHRAEVARILGLDPSSVPDKNSLAYDQILQGVDEGRIKGLWVIATNTSHSWVNRAKTDSVLSKLDFLVVQDMFATTETVEFADLYLPAAGWGEKDGFFINSERRLGLCKKIARAPGEALSDFHIFRLVAEAWGCEHKLRRWRSPTEVFQILKELSRGMPCDFTGIADYQMIDEHGGIQWPLPEGTRGFDRERRLFENGCFYHADRKARFLFDPPQPMPEPVDEQFPMLLLTGRGTSSQWHTQTRTGKSSVLKLLYPEKAYIEIHPQDAARFRISDRDKVRVSSRRGVVLANAFITATVQPGQVFMPMHYEETNHLTHPSFDPWSRQPSYKACAVAIAAASDPQKKRSSV
jgi:assimilatory nitrate reductase catalytic subunit